MAIKKKGKVDFLRDVDAAAIDTSEEDPKKEIEEPEAGKEFRTDVEENHSAASRRHKDVSNWGRPRRLLVDGVKEKSITVQLPENLIAYLRKEAKRTRKSMKELIGEPLLEKYMDVSRD